MKKKCSNAESFVKQGLPRKRAAIDFSKKQMNTKTLNVELRYFFVISLGAFVSNFAWR